MSEERIPRQVEEADLGAHSMSPQEAFVHSCIDGVLNVEDIADLTVLEPALVAESVERMISLGLVEWVEAKVSSAPPAAQLVEDVEIDEALQDKILQTFKRADRLNHYELLGVTTNSDRAEIRKAYFALSKTFHPDSYYGKRLGSFKAQMEVVFRKMTDAYEVIGRQQKRDAYDRYLKRSIVVSAAEEKISRVEERAQAMSKALTRAPVAERQAEPVDPEAPSRDWQPSQAPSKQSRSVVSGSPDHERMQRKRELLEKRLRGRSRRPPRKSEPVRSMPAPTAKVGAKTALRDLTRSLKRTAGVTGGVDRAEHHIETARLAEASGDLAAAATALRMAITLDSSRSDIQEQYRRVNSHLRVQLLDIHREQAKYEEDNNLWAAASISWAKVADADPKDAIAPRRAARALLSAGGDLRKARDFAQRSLDLAPDSLEARLLLARIYIQAGMDNSAAKELDEAAKLDPGHEMVKNLREQLAG
ncbi:MAG: DnaJ domain-containing protein [Myxococcales bacterium]|nr:DnaJ domain-containing protein [Deltaproteobacteria bacterium]MBT8481627.1 DnaJ domain-containing protein [Deltaproteobacteria bacterium]NNL24489.1 DnaJ domain-containing protein [Myxococcales bacterium]RZV50862.1 MAG: tetratricopeptide repeat protein [Deltaproteobacteria bacterium]